MRRQKLLDDLDEPTVPSRPIIMQGDEFNHNDVRMILKIAGRGNEDLGVKRASTFDVLSYKIQLDRNAFETPFRNLLIRDLHPLNDRPKLDKPDDYTEDEDSDGAIITKLRVKLAPDSAFMHWVPRQMIDNGGSMCRDVVAERGARWRTEAALEAEEKRKKETKKSLALEKKEKKEKGVEERAKKRKEKKRSSEEKREKIKSKDGSSEDEERSPVKIREKRIRHRFETEGSTADAPKLKRVSKVVVARQSSLSVTPVTKPSLTTIAGSRDQLKYQWSDDDGDEVYQSKHLGKQERATAAQWSGTTGFEESSPGSDVQYRGPRASGSGSIRKNAASFTSAKALVLQKNTTVLVLSDSDEDEKKVASRRAREESFDPNITPKKKRRPVVIEIDSD